MSRRRTLEPSKAVAYVRVSTSEQDLGPQAQVDAIERWCRKHEIEIVAAPFFDHGVSGGLDFEKRPGLVEAIDALKQHGAGTLVAHKRDRIARDREVIGNLGLMLRKMGCRICTTDQNKATGLHEVDPIAKAMEGVQDIFAELERAMIRARTRAALGVKRRRSERIGTIPYGYRLGADDKTLKIYPPEQRLIRTVHDLRDSGLSLRAICAELTRLNLKPKRGKAWHTSSIRGILAHEPKGSH